MIWLVFAALTATADPIRIATYDTEASRKGPGLMLRDILSDNDPQIDALTQVIAAARADILLLQSVDFDAGLRGSGALRDKIAQRGLYYPHVFALPPNSGLPTGLDMDGDGRLGRARDAQGYGRFRGQGGMVILSRYPFDIGAAQDFSALLWRDLPGATLPEQDDAPFPSADVQAVQRLSSVGHWVVPVMLPDGALHVMAFHATTPVFDGPEDRNGLRNADELRLWSVYLDGGFGPAVQERFVLMGNANLDPARGEGRRDAIKALLSDPRLAPTKPGAPTVVWDKPSLPDMRVSYILPSADIPALASGVIGAAADGPKRKAVTTASRHRLVWADLPIEDARISANARSRP